MPIHTHSHSPTHDHHIVIYLAALQHCPAQHCTTMSCTAPSRFVPLLHDIEISDPAVCEFVTNNCAIVS